jgi:hypothetical protein
LRLSKRRASAAAVHRPFSQVPLTSAGNGAKTPFLATGTAFRGAERISEIAMSKKTLVAAIAAIAAAVVAGSLTLPGSVLAGERYRDGHHRGTPYCGSPRKHFHRRGVIDREIARKRRGPVYVPVWPDKRRHFGSYRWNDARHHGNHRRPYDNHRDFRITYRDRRD